MSIAEVIAHQDKLACRCKKDDCATCANCVCKKIEKLCKLQCHGERGVNTQYTLCEIK